MGLMDKAKEALDTEQGRNAVEKGLDKAQDVAKDKLGDDKSEHIDKARKTVDEHLNLGENNDEQKEDDK